MEYCSLNFCTEGLCTAHLGALQGTSGSVLAFTFGLLVTLHGAGLEKLVYRLIVLFLPTEIFSKRRKIYAWF